LVATGAIDLRGRDASDVARLLCFCITKSVSPPYLWGLIENMSKPDFRLIDAVSFIWDDYYNKQGAAECRACDAYYPIARFERRVFATIDSPYTSDIQNCHRSGWAYAIGGLRNFDASLLMRTPSIEIDTYVDRTFHWGAETLETVGVLPYTRSWIGFVHHTYETTHSDYNCIKLFQKRVFLDSLRCCRGLIALTDTLAAGLRASLAGTAEGQDVPVFVLCHPMESVDDRFTMEKFYANKSRMVVQIGSWLRNCYSIYELPMWKNVLQLRKAALRGKEMSEYFPKDGLLDELRHGLHLDDGHAFHHFGDGLLHVIERDISSVTVLERLSDAEYDELLSRNLVFLDLIDCSAVNTVLECLVRNTVIVVRRHAAIEEMLGVKYPGFFDDLVDATMMLNDDRTLREAHAYLCGLDKSRFTLDRFVEDVQKVCAEVA
jgi:hypothetical protein